jgi:hypothetical protein
MSELSLQLLLILLSSLPDKPQATAQGYNLPLFPQNNNSLFPQRDLSCKIKNSSKLYKFVKEPSAMQNDDNKTNVKIDKIFT